MIEDMADLSVEYFRDICKAVHMDRISLPGFMLDTIYSNICDLNQGLMYIYFFHDYDHFIDIRIPDIFEQGNQVYDLPSLFVDNSSHNPNKPEIVSGKISGRIKREYEYSTVSNDEDGDLLFYFFDWGDGTNSGWIGYYDSGETCSTSHIWTEEGNYEIKVKTKDLFGYESEWSDSLSISMPKNKIINNHMIEWLLSRFPFLEFLL